MSPDEINTKHGNAVWKCVTCRAESGLHWWHGLSVAVCNNEACGAAFGEKCRAQEEEQAAYEEHCREYWG